MIDKEINESLRNSCNRLENELLKTKLKLSLSRKKLKLAIELLKSVRPKNKECESDFECVAENIQKSIDKFVAKEYYP